MTVQINFIQLHHPGSPLFKKYAIQKVISRSGLIQQACDRAQWQTLIMKFHKSRIYLDYLNYTY
jgi:hypothetical protein